MGSLNTGTVMRTSAGLSLFLLVSLASAQEDDPVAALADVIPGEPGEDYPIFAFAPDTSFLCDGQIQGYYADPEADCQSFHICANLGDGGLTKYSFLCPTSSISSATGGSMWTALWQSPSTPSTRRSQKSRQPTLLKVWLV